MSRLGENQRRGDNQRVEHGGAARPSASTSGGSTPAGYHPARRTSSLTASLSRLGSGLTLNLTLTLTLTLILTLTAQNLNDAVHTKRSKCAAGINAITYLVYKKCPAARCRLIKIMKRVWKEKVIPKSWQCGFIILIPKATTTDLNDPGEFRPIALINVEGRLFFTLMEWRLSDVQWVFRHCDTERISARGWWMCGAL